MVDVHMLIITYLLFMVCYDICCACTMLWCILQILQMWTCKFLTKLNLIITGNGLMTGLVKFDLMQLLLKGEACNI